MGITNEITNLCMCVFVKGIIIMKRGRKFYKRFALHLITNWTESFKINSNKYLYWKQFVNKTSLTFGFYRKKSKCVSVTTVILI